ncbi:MAG: Carbon monoxide dehydrogenase medium chain [Syntrophorhabdaceae bacterium PtaU1.Bin034]|jgi:carbon-monoxide dehydrogenase medium subunit|nr:MAG: Carbon monoxide dehydrogenase medium chain [Syntrophorhabdaceae bacterium PtaU1.Bin034]
MLLNLPEFEYVSCETVEEACSLLSTYNGDARVFAGGTDMLVKMKHRRATPRKLINIKKIKSLDYIDYDEADGLRIGALTTIDSLARSTLVMRQFPILGQAAGVLGTPHVRNLATLGGNLCNASPAAECAPALITMGAEATLSGPEGRRTVPLEEFFTGPGRSVVRSDELLTEIRVPRQPAGTVGVHLKHGSRRVDVAVAGASVLMTFDGEQCKDIKIALSSVGPTPLRAKEAESILKGETVNEEKRELIDRAARTASAESRPIDDLRGRAGERRDIIESLVKEAINRLISGRKKIISLDTFVGKKSRN